MTDLERIEWAIRRALSSHKGQPADVLLRVIADELALVQKEIDLVDAVNLARGP